MIREGQGQDWLGPALSWVPNSVQSGSPIPRTAQPRTPGALLSLGRWVRRQPSFFPDAGRRAPHDSRAVAGMPLGHDLPGFPEVNLADRKVW